MQKISIVIVEPDQNFRDRLVTCLSRESDFTIVHTCDRAEEIFQPDSFPIPVDVLLINIDQPQMTDTGIWAGIHIAFPETRIVALTSGENDLILEIAFAVNVAALQRVDAEVSDICRAIRCSVQGVLDYAPSLVKQAKFSVTQVGGVAFMLASCKSIYKSKK